jgi:hypothetical protein
MTKLNVTITKGSEANLSTTEHTADRKNVILSRKIDITEEVITCATFRIANNHIYVINLLVNVEETRIIVRSIKGSLGNSITCDSVEHKHTCVCVERIAKFLNTKLLLHRSAGKVASKSITLCERLCALGVGDIYLLTLEKRAVVLKLKNDLFRHDEDFTILLVTAYVHVAVVSGVIEHNFV